MLCWGYNTTTFVSQGLIYFNVGAFYQVANIVGPDDIINLREQIKEKLSTYAYLHSIRSGRKMNIDEMNTLLREMEQVDHSG